MERMEEEEEENERVSRASKKEKHSLRELHKDGQMSMVMNAVQAYAAFKPHTHSHFVPLTQTDTYNMKMKSGLETKYENANEWMEMCVYVCAMNVNGAKFDERPFTFERYKLNFSIQCGRLGWVAVPVHIQRGYGCSYGCGLWIFTIHLNFN